jgi:hypothetical protein
VLLEVLMTVAVLAVPVPALVIGARGLLRRTGHPVAGAPADRVEFGLIVAGRVLGLLLLVALSGITLLSCIGGMVKGVDVPSLVYVFCIADLLIGVLVLLTVGPRGRRPARRSATPARR